MTMHGSLGAARLVALSCVYSCFAVEAGAAPMHGPRCAVPNPLAVRGGVLMVPLVADRPGSDWPRTLVLIADDGRRLPGTVAWVHPQRADDAAGWTSDPRGLAVRRIEPSDDTNVESGSRPFLLTPLPVDCRGTLRLGRQRIEPRWLDAVDRAVPDGPVLELSDSLNRPDPVSPLEYWRWVQLAGRLGTAPPPAELYGEVGSLVARHYSDLWRIGLLRLGRADPDALHRCLNLLLRICYDGPQAFAAWVVDPGEIGSLLQVLVDLDRSDGELVEAVEQWAGRQGPLVLRVVPRDPFAVAVAVANRSRLVIEASFQWLGSSEVAATMSLAPGVLHRVEMPRSARRDGPGGVDLARARARARGHGDVQVLLVEAAGKVTQMTFPTGPLQAEPPGVGFELRPPLTLAEVQSGRRSGGAGRRTTFLQLRRRHSRWEIFLECRRPGRLPRAADLAGLRDAAEMRGREAITLLLGATPASVVLAVPETGDYRLFRGSDDGTLEIHRQSYADRWYCRIVVPQRWLPTEAEYLLIGATRTHDDSDLMETGPFASLPWRPDPGRAVIDLRSWTDITPDGNSSAP